MNNPSRKPLLGWQLFHFLAWVQGMIALGTFLDVPVGIPEISRMRLVFGLIGFLITCVFLYFLIESFLWKNVSISRVSKILESPHQKFYLVLSIILFLISAFLVSLTPEIEEPFTKAIFMRLLPFLIWIAGVSGQTALVYLFMLYKIGDWHWQSGNRSFVVILTILGVFFLIWALVVNNTFARESQVTGWYQMGTPLLETQVFLAWLISILFLGIITWLTSAKSMNTSFQKLIPKRLDLFIASGLWLISVLLWWQVPLAANWFVSEPRYPNFEFYPNSDARAYDTSAQTALIGEDFQFYKSDIVRRPLLSFYLSLFHLVGGQDYIKVIFLQILLLAAFPAIVYLLTAQIHSRLSGVMAGLLIAFREANSIRLGSQITTSHAKLMMADLPTALAVSIFMLLVILWFKEIKHNQVLALASGGALGAAALIRAETLVFIAVILVLSAWKLNLKNHFRLWAKNVILFLLGISLVISPWVVRNTIKTGRVFLDSPTIFRLELVILRYRPQKTQIPITTPQATTVPAATPVTGTQNTPTPLSPAEGLEKVIEKESSTVLDYIRNNTGEIFSFILTHYANSQLQTFLILPSTIRIFDAGVSSIGHRSFSRFIEECCSSIDYVRHLPYWHNWDGRFPLQSSLPILLNMILIALGLSTAWRKWHFTGLIPALLNITYLGLNAVFRNSGGRYIIPVDWVAVVYFSIGLGEVTAKIIPWVNNRRTAGIYFVSDPLHKKPKQRSPIKQSKAFYLLMAGILLFGSLIPVYEALFPRKYTLEVKDQMLFALMRSEIITTEDQTMLQSFLSAGGEVRAGRALYPRVYPPRVGEPGAGNPFGPWPYPRVAFTLIGPYHEVLALPITKKPPAFPNGADVLIFKCGGQSDLLALAIFDSTGNPIYFYSRQPMPQKAACPLPLPFNLSGGE